MHDSTPNNVPRPLWRAVAEEVSAMALSGLLVPFGLTRDKRTTPRQSDQRTVVLVHGYMANRSTMLPLAGYLRWRGHKQVLTFNYASTDGIVAAARALDQHLKAHVRGGRIDLVCHSMGGLVARTWLQDLGGARRVDRCITLATPHQGTYSAYWLATRAARQMRPDSELIQRLEATRDTAASVQFTSLVADADHLVLPRRHAGHEDVVIVPEIGHVGLLWSPRVLSFVGDCLGEEAPQGQVPADQMSMTTGSGSVA